MIRNTLDYENLKDDSLTKRKSKLVTSKKSASRKKEKRSRFALPKFLTDIFSNKVVLRKIGFTIFIIGAYRFLSSIPLPGVDMRVYAEYFGSSSASEVSLLFSTFTGGSFETPSIVGLGIIAYINASIIMQLLTPVIPKLSELSKEGARGQQLINQYTRYLTLPLAFIYSFVYLMVLSRNDLSSSTGEVSANPAFLIPHAAGSDWPNITKLVFMALILTAGTMLLMWLAESVNEHGLGNGSSIIISVGILASMPTLISTDFAGLNIADTVTQVLQGNFAALTNPSLIAILGVIIGAVLFIGFIVFVNESVRKIPIQYARRASLTEAAQDSNLPIKLALTGVLPMIFASALLSVPQLIVPVLQSGAEAGSRISRWLESIQGSFLFSSIDNVVDGGDFIYAVVYFLMILGFAVFYSFIVLKPKDTAENLQQNSAFIPGIRPGNSTQKYISNVLIRISFAGGIVLGFIALLPLVSRNLIVTSTGVNLFVLSGIGGTSILIIVSVVMETIRQYNALRVSRSYEQYAG